MPTILQKNIIKELGLEELPEKTQAEILAKIGESLLKRVIVNSLEQLSEQDRQEFEKIQKKAKPEEIDNFLKSKISDYEQMVFEIVKEYKDEIKETIGKLTS